MNTNRMEKFWDKLASRFDRITARLGFLPVEQAKQHLESGDVVLDFGCATGAVLLSQLKRIHSFHRWGVYWIKKEKKYA